MPSSNDELNVSDLISIAAGKDMSSKFYEMSSKSLLAYLKQMDDPEVAKILANKWGNIRKKDIDDEVSNILKQYEDYSNKEGK